MILLNTLLSLYYDRTEELSSFEKVKDQLFQWCNDHDLPLSLSEDQRTNAISLKVFDRDDKIIFINNASGKLEYKRRLNFEEYSLELDGIDSEGGIVKWQSSYESFSSKKKFFIQFNKGHGGFDARFTQDAY